MPENTRFLKDHKAKIRKMCSVGPYSANFAKLGGQTAVAAALGINQCTVSRMAQNPIHSPAKPNKKPKTREDAFHIDQPEAVTSIHNHWVTHSLANSSQSFHRVL
jgi:hypothetical protein